MFTFKGTVSVISSDAPCKDGIAWFTTVPWVRNMQVTFAEKAQMKINSLLKKTLISNSCLIKAFKVTVENRSLLSLNEGPIKIRIQSLYMSKN